ncbi:hypothetical protein GGF45_002829, partial [Coemansia sp. RSA 551]
VPVPGPDRVADRSAARQLRPDADFTGHRRQAHGGHIVAQRRLDQHIPRHEAAAQQVPKVRRSTCHQNPAHQTTLAQRGDCRAWHKSL